MIFGIHQYAISGNASGISFLQRMVYWQAAISLIRRHPVLGIGTGDVKKSFYDIYEEEHSNLEPQYRNRAHNQFLTFFVSFGVAGFLLFIAVFLYPLIFSRPGFLFSAFLLIAFLSCITEDTLETQAGVTFFAFFYGLFASREMGTTSAGTD
jgi:O-antigen ligase